MTHRMRNGKYRLTIPAPIELGLRIVDEERVPRSDWGEIDRTPNRDDTPDEQSEEENVDSPHTPAAGDTDEETELQKIAEAIPTPTNLQPGNLFTPSIFTPSAFMASTTQTTTQVHPPRQSLCLHLPEKQRREDQDHREEGEDKASQTR